MDSESAELDLGLDDDPLPAPADLPAPRAAPPPSAPPPSAPSAPAAPAAPPGAPLGDALDFIGDTADRAGGEPESTSGQPELKVRRRNGRIEGPYGMGRIITMLRNKEFNGNEDVSEDGVSWRAMTSHAQLNKVINEIMAAEDQDTMNFGQVDLGGGGGGGGIPPATTGGMDLGLEADEPSPAAAPPPAGGAGAPPTNLDQLMDSLELDEGAGQEEGGEEAPRQMPKDSSELAPPVPGGGEGGDELEVGEIPELPPIWQTYKKQILIFAGVIAVVLLGIGTHFSSIGLFGATFFAELLKPPPPPAPAPPPPPPAKAARPEEIGTLIDEGSYEAFRSVFATISQAGQDHPDNKLYAAKASGFATLAYGPKLFPIADLKAAVEALNTLDLSKVLKGNTAAANVEILKARSMLEILSGKADSAASQLSALIETRSNDKELALILGLARAKTNDSVGAIEALDKAIVADAKYAPALHAIGEIVLASGDKDAKEDAAAWFEKALEAQPAHSRSGKALVAVYKDLNRYGEQRRAMFITATHFDRGLPPEERAPFLSETAKTFDKAGRLGEALKFAQEAARLDPTKNEYLALSASALAASGAAAEGGKLLAPLLKRTPNDVPALIAQARVFDAADDVAKSFISLDAAQQANPRNYMIHVWRARFNLRLGKINDARKAMEFAIRVAKGADPLPNIDLGRLDLKLGDVDAAYKNAQDAVKIDPHDVRTHVLLGDCYKVRSQLDKALEAFRTAMTLDDENLGARLGYANSLRDQSLKGGKYAVKLAEAVPIYLEALEERPKDPRVLFEYGRVLELGGDVGQALDLYKEAATFDKEDVRPHIKMVAAYMEQEPPDVKLAKKSLKRAHRISVKSGRKDPEILFWNARVSYAEKRYSDAVGAMRNAVDMERRNAMFHYWLGVMQEANQDFLEAVNSYQKAVQLNSRLAKAHRSLGRANVERKMFEKARKSFNAFKKSAPDDTTIFFDIGLSFTMQNRDEDALKNFMVVVKHHPKHTKALLAIGEILGRQGKEKKAHSYFERAAKSDPKDGDAQCTFGISLSRRGKLSADAKRVLKACVANEKDAPNDKRQIAKDILETAGVRID